MSFLFQNDPTAAFRWVYFECFDDDSGDGYAPKTGLTFAAGELQIAKPGAAYANAANYASVVEAGFGGYWYPASVGELDTLGECLIIPVKTDVYAKPSGFQVVPWNPNNATSLGLANIATAVQSPTEIADEVWDLADGVETGMTPRQALRLLCAVLGGQTEGADTNSEKFLAAVAAHKIRATVTLVGSDRSSVAVDLD